MKKLAVLGLLICIISFACDDRDDNLTSANIRINNKTDIGFTLLEFVPDSLFYENVAPGGFSKYLEFETAFELMPFTIETDSANFSFVPPNLTLEPLPIGIYTYEVDINDEGQVEVAFRID